MNPENLKYHNEHTWVNISGDNATIGITDYAQESLGDVVYIELPEPETSVEADSALAEIESTKATASIISPVSGDVTEVNEDLSDSPEIINEDPYEKGWIAVIKLENHSEIDNLMDASEYDKYLDEEVKQK
jgi:glycine cleavage system H protein